MDVRAVRVGFRLHNMNTSPGASGRPEWIAPSPGREEEMKRHFSLTAIAFSAALLQWGLEKTWAQGATFTKLNQSDLNALVSGGDGDAAFDEAFEHGDGLFEDDFNEIDGGGAKVGTVFNGTGMIRYTRVPRATLQGTGEWEKH